MLLSLKNGAKLAKFELYRTNISTLTPTVTSAATTDGATFVFSRAMNESSITAATVTAAADGTALTDGKRSYDMKTKTLTVYAPKATDIALTGLLAQSGSALASTSITRTVTEFASTKLNSAQYQGTGDYTGTTADAFYYELTTADS